MRVLVIVIVVLILSIGAFHELCSSFVLMKTNIMTLARNLFQHFGQIFVLCKTSLCLVRPKMESEDSSFSYGVTISFCYVAIYKTIICKQN
jgi:hypothetical protein